MALIIGTDEAGYGPNLGPLLIAATAWQVPNALKEADLYELLGEAVARADASSAAAGVDRLPVGDSKLLYKPGGGLGLLELGVLALANATGAAPRTWSDAWHSLTPACKAKLSAEPWYGGYDEPLPCAAAIEQTERYGELLRQVLKRRGVQLLAIEARAIFAGEWNALLETHGGKAEVLSRQTLALVRDLAERFDERPMFVRCDKHGGRSRYAALLQDAFPDPWVQVRVEGRESSVYWLGRGTRRCEFRFDVQGERHLATAAASMTAKYMRELAMRAFNAFWCAQQPGLRPTAGYPLDAKRFYEEIAPVQSRLGIDHAVLWRLR